MRALALQGPDLSKWFGGQGRTLRDPDAAPVLGLSPPRALLIALAHLVNLGTPPAPGPYLLSHQTDPGDPILSFPSNISIRGGQAGAGAGAGKGKGTASRLRAARDASEAARGEEGRRLHLRVAGVGREVGTKGTGQRGLAYPGKDQLLRRGRGRPPRIIVAREDGEDRDAANQANWRAVKRKAKDMPKLPPRGVPPQGLKAKWQNPETGKDEDLDMSKWVCVYPCYIDKMRSMSQGRRVPRECAVERPNVIEIKDSCQHLGLACLVEDKSHPADFFSRGRVRVMLRRPDNGEPISKDVANRKQLLREICKLVPKHVMRQKANEQRLQQQAAASAKAKEGSSSSSSSKKQSNKKKGKKKGKKK